MYLTHFIILNNELMNKYLDVVPEQSPLIILDIKSALYMAQNGKDAKHTGHIVRRIHFLINAYDWNLHNTVRR